MRTSAPLALAAVLLLAACGGGSDGSSPSDTTPTPPPEYDFSAVEQEIDDFIAETPGIEGAGAVIVHRDHGVIFQRGFGAFEESRIYLLASSSKMITAGVLMRLQDEGILDVNEPIIDAVPWGDANPTITPAQLVSNSSGLVGLGPNPTFGPYLCQYIYSGSLQDCGRQIFTTAGDDDMVIPPDTEFRYGGGQWQVAGAVAEIVSGKSWEQLIRETYVEPCGLETLGFNNHFVQLVSEAGLFSYPTAFASDPANLQPTANPNMEGGAYASIGDYGKLLLMHLRGGLCGENRVRAEEAVRQMHEDRIGAAYDGSTGGGWGGYGLGWWVDREGGNVVDPGAYGAFPWLDEERGYGAFLAMEATSAHGAVLYERTVDLIEQAIDGAE